MFELSAWRGEWGRQEEEKEVPRGKGAEDGDLLASFLGLLANYDSICISSNKLHPPQPLRGTHTYSHVFSRRFCEFLLLKR